MLEILTLVVQLDCSHPRVSFRDYFRAMHSYSLEAPPAGAQQQFFIEDMGQSAADYVEYAVRWADKCGRPTH